MSRIHSLAFILLFSLTATAQDVASLEKLFRNAYVGKIATLRHFSERSNVSVDENGALKGDPQSGPWTLYSKVAIARFDVGPRKIKLHGTRVFVGPDETGKERIKLFRTTDAVTLEAELSQPPSKESIERALRHLFLTSSERLVDRVPDYWREYLQPASPSYDPPSRSSRPQPGEGSQERAPKKVRVSAGMLRGRALKQQRPVYPEAAKSFRRTGTVVLRGRISREGRVIELVIVKPAGFGLDEAAVEAVRMWEYVPYHLDGEPVEVETQITVNFTIG